MVMLIYVSECVVFYLYLLDKSFFCFCFFKQKTAYEMRISDWSSDVCSSDLQHPDSLTISSTNFLTIKNLCSIICKHSIHALWEIGRASCRERVCQYV